MPQLLKNETFCFHDKQWKLTFCIPETEGEILNIQHENVSVIRVTNENGILTASVLFSARETPITLKGWVQEKDCVTILNEHFKISLYVNNMLKDEDWPIGVTNLENAECTILKTDVSINVAEPSVQKHESRDIISRFRNAQNFKPAGHNTRAGDCMPFYSDGTYHLFYLFDRRGHNSKWGLGAHQWGHISTKDLVNWEEHPLAIAIDRQEEGSICTGSVVIFEGIYYAYYAVRMCDGSPAKLTWSTSRDSIHFQKSNQIFTLSTPYEPASARDPKVFMDNDGIFHMLVTTSLVSDTGNKGCLAHAVSDDLINWEQKEPIVVLDIEDQPECCDYFYKNGFYYLIYSNYSLAHYYISEEPFGPWTAPESNLIVNDVYRVPKRDFWKDDRIIFAGTHSDGGFGGTVLFYEAKQRTDGTLEFTEVPEMRSLS